MKKKERRRTRDEQTAKTLRLLEPKKKPNV
jgi:hypothetical protein